jgi:hypothetical protein
MTKTGHRTRVVKAVNDENVAANFSKTLRGNVPFEENKGKPTPNKRPWGAGSGLAEGSNIPAVRLTLPTVPLRALQTGEIAWVVREPKRPNTRLIRTKISCSN